MASQQEAAGAGSGMDDPDQEQAGGGGEEAAALEGGGSWYWTNMLNFSQSGSSSTHTSAGGHVAAGSQFAAGSPPSSSSVHNNNTNTLQFNTNNEQVDHAATPLDSMLPSSNNPASNNDPENAVWSQDFLSGPICESKSGMAACSGDDGLQELLYPRSVRELLLDVQSSSWDLLQQAAISKSFGFPLGPDDPHLHGLVPNPDVKPAHGVQAGLHFSHDDRLSCSTASSTLSENALAEPHWSATQAALTDHATCAMHVPHTTFAQHQFDHTRVKQEYSPQPSATSASPFAKAGAINPFLLQHQQQQQSLRLISPAHDMQASEAAAAMANVNADIKPAKQQQLQSWPGSPAAAGPNLCRTSSANFQQAPSPAAGALDHRHHFLLNSLKHHQLLDSGSFTRAMSPSFFQDVDHHHLLQQSGLQPHLYRQAADNGALSNHPAQYLDQGGGLKKSRAHLEIGHPVKELKGVAASADDFSFKRPKIEPQQQPASASLKSQPVRKEKLGDRITTLQQLVSPYGKTDTASVLLEAIGYIKFLQEQVQTLSKPYLKSASNSITQCGDKNQNGDDSKPDLRSKGLCLVPLSCTMQVANDNGADYWYGGAFK